MRLKHMYQIKVERADGSPVLTEPNGATMFEDGPATEEVVTVFSRRSRRLNTGVIDGYGPEFVSYVRDCGWIRVDA